MSHFTFLLFGWAILTSFHSIEPERGSIIDYYNKIPVYYNGDKFSSVSGRNVTVDGYNLGLKYQCVEFVKRYYHDKLNHKMKDSYGHAKDYFDKSLSDAAFNKQRGLYQYRNAREVRPEKDDIIVFDKDELNNFGHIAIISEVNEKYIEIVQQNVGKVTRVQIPLVNYYKYWTVADYNVLGWLRK
ncbi:MAG: CHAP domain-containing protein [Saprospiraceae bacterium]|nr:CHAP domain-containing protein [Saprospiraceae bacterium]